MKCLTLLVLQIFFALLCIPVSDGQTESGENREHLESILANLRKYAKADAKKDFAAAQRGGDFRFVGMMGYGLSVPGVPNYEKLYSRSVGVRVIPGTTDAIVSNEQLQLQEAVRAYARQYNELVLARLAKQSKRK